MILRRRLAPVIAVVVTVAVTGTTQAQTVAATTLGAGGTFNATSQYVIGGTASSFQFIATSFTYGGPSGLVLDQLRVGLTTGSFRTYVVTLLRGSDITTASTVTAWNVPIAAPAPGASLFSLAAVGNFALTSSETYWLAVSGLGTAGGWSFAPTGTQRAVFVRDEFSSTWRSDGVRQAPAYEVTVREASGPSPSVVPEPSAVLLFGAGMAALALLAHRRRSA